MIKLPGLYYLNLTLKICQLRDQNVVGRRATGSGPMRCFVLTLLQFFEKNIIYYVLTTGAFTATMTGTNDDRVGDVRCIDMLLAVKPWAANLQVHW